jgi:uncharacterized membrane protein YhfC
MRGNVQMISLLSIAGMVIQFILSVGFPIFLLLYFHRKQGISWKSIMIGALTFVVFVLFLEKMMHSYLLQGNTSTANFFKSHPIILALYGALAAGIFEEIGRYISFTILLSKYRERKDGISYGIGHGGIEAVVLGGISIITAISLALSINAGTFDQMVGNQPDMGVLKKTLLETPFYIYFVAAVERIGAVFIQIALSLIVLYGVKQQKWIYLVGAILFHALIDLPVGFYQTGLIPLWIAEGFILVWAVISITVIRKSKTWFIK